MSTYNLVLPVYSYAIKTSRVEWLIGMGTNDSTDLTVYYLEHVIIN